MLIAMKGPPGAGKSTLARSLSRELGWPLIDKDDFKDLLDGPVEAPTSGALAYELMLRLAQRQLSLGLSVICDSSLLALTYSGLRRIAEAEGVPLCVVECQCRDEAIWRQRITARQTLDLPAHHTVTWDRLQAFLVQPGVSYELTSPHLVVDTARPLVELVDEVTAWILTSDPPATRGSKPLATNDEGP